MSFNFYNINKDKLFDKNVLLDDKIFTSFNEFLKDIVKVNE